MPLDLFALQVPTSEQHPHFRELMSGNYEPEKGVLASWANGFVDRDGKFVREFQTTFWSSFWELYLFACFKEVGFTTDFSQRAPDFALTTPSGPVAAEATVAREAAGYVSERHRRPGEPIPKLDIAAVIEYATIRLANAFATKLEKYRNQYAKLPHVHGRPFVLCLAPFEQPVSFVQNDQAIRRVLYKYDLPVWIDAPDLGTRTIVGETSVESVEKDSGSRIQLGFFADASAPEVSAVIFSSTAAWAKMRALAPACSHPVIFDFARYNDAGSTPFRAVQKKEEYRETLLDGLHVFLNPFATHPFNPAQFAGREVSIHERYDPEIGLVRSHVPDRFLIQRTCMGFTSDPSKARRQETAEAGRREPAVRPFPEDELRPVGGQVPPFVDNHLAHYRGWTIVVARHLEDNDWGGQAVKGTFRDLSTFIRANKDGKTWLIGDEWLPSKEECWTDMKRHIDLNLEGK